MDTEKKVYIFTGHYGSGKTETAMNFAYKLRGEKPGSEHKIAIIDMDIVNPFFRTADAKQQLEDDGFKVELTAYANTNVDVPALTGAMGGIIQDREYDVILDVGGDDLGAKAVGRYSQEISERCYEQYFVINIKRPFTNSLEAASRVFDEIEAASCLKCTGIINNTNLLDETVLEDILQGQEIVEKLAAQKGVPVAFYAIDESIANDVKCIGKEQIIPIRRMVKRLF